MKKELKFFRDNGYFVVPEALSSLEVATLNQAIDEDRERYDSLWLRRGEGGRRQSVSVLLSSAAFDGIIRHPVILERVEALMGEGLCFEELSVMIREPLTGEPPAASWHRDQRHWQEHPLVLKNLSVVYYLTDVDETTHAFAIVPEAVETKRADPRDVDPDRGIELYGRAGTAILFNAASVHAGVVKQTLEQRRTIHIYYGHRSLPPLSNHTIVPRRLLEAGDEASRRFYGRPNLLTELMDRNF